MPDDEVRADKGGILPSGLSTVTNNYGRPLIILTGQQWKDYLNGR